MKSLLKHTARSRFTALLPVNSTHIKAANCRLHNLQPFNSANPHEVEKHKKEEEAYFFFVYLSLRISSTFSIRCGSISFLVFDQ